MPADKFNPHLFYYPALSFYFYLGPFVLLYLVHAILTTSFSLTNFSILFFAKPHLFFLFARISAALLFCVSVWLCFKVLQKVSKSSLVTLGVTLLYAVNPLLVENHHFALTDAVSNFAALAAIWYFLGFQGKNKKEMIIAGIFAGLAVSAKFTNSVLPVLFIVYLILAKKINKEFFIYCALFIFVCLLTFVVINPYFLLSYNQALNEFKQLGEVTKGSGMQDVISFLSRTFMVFITNFNVVVFILMIVAVIISVSQIQNKKMFCLSIYVILCFLLMLTHPKYFYPRYLFPVFVPLYILLAFAIDKWLNQKRFSLKIIFLLLSLSALYGTALCINIDVQLLQKKPIAETYYWIQQ